MPGIDAPGELFFDAASRQRWRPPPGEIRVAAACVQLSGPVGSRELHLIGAVSAASGSDASSASGRRRFGVRLGSWTLGQTPGRPLGSRRRFFPAPHLFLRSFISPRSPLRRRSSG